MSSVNLIERQTMYSSCSVAPAAAMDGGSKVESRIIPCLVSMHLLGCQAELAMFALFAFPGRKVSV